ncbi:carcinoembryonic antigen-related cell adhesion molecule 1-like [Dreissena polymorpha]|uniref:carcinoembryonic antigen-related cell adhesion molecule 1-like n=1 Tax=Dreissena polymorpha TaxID=45954 RepID=UPI002263C485|nr:carcinoembryonic antigen-related cell adhesion molecule 1-like [Dreissena polymorpha]
MCTSPGGYPVHTVNWYQGNTSVVQSGSPSVTESNGLYNVSRYVTFTPTSADDGRIYICQSFYSGYPQLLQSSSVRFILNQRPHISPILSQTAVEGSSHTLPCEAQSKPPATFRWYKKGLNDIIYQTSGTIAFNQGPYTISLVKRSHSGIYTCTADNTILSRDEKDVTLTVQYPPDVTVVVENTTSLMSESRLICKASGVPNTYTFHPTWSQHWPEYGKIRDWTGSLNTLTLSNLTYAHSGYYTCSATNGIHVSGTGHQYMPGSGYLLVKDAPVITFPADTSHRIASDLGQKVSSTLYVYSNSGDVNVSVFKVLNDSRGASSVGSVNISYLTVQLPVFNNIVPMWGFLVNISLFMEEAEDFGVYEAIVSNVIGNRTLRINIETQENTATAGSFVASIAGGVIGGILVCAIIVLSIILLWRRDEIQCFCKRRALQNEGTYEASHARPDNNEHPYSGCQNQPRIESTSHFDTNSFPTNGQLYEQLRKLVFELTTV